MFRHKPPRPFRLSAPDAGLAQSQRPLGWVERVQAGWARSCSQSRLLVPLRKWQGALTVVRAGRIPVFPVAGRMVAVLEGLLIVQVLTTPVLPLSFPLLAATLGLIAFSRAAHSLTRLVFGEIWLLYLGALFALGAGLATNFHGTEIAFWELEGYILLAWLAGNCFTAEFCRKLLRYLVFSSGVWLMIGFAQSWAGTPTPLGWLGSEQAGTVLVRSYAVFGNPNIYAIYLLSIIGFTIGLSGSKSESFQVRAGARVILGLALGALYLTYSRFSWLLAAWCLGAWRTKGTVWRNCRAYLLGLAVLVNCAGFRIRLFSLLALTDSSLAYRWQIWQGVAKALREHWLWGNGPGSFQSIYPWFQVGATPSQHAHSLYFQLWLDYGLIGLVAGLILAGKIISRLKSMNADSALKTVGLAWMLFLGSGLSESWQVSRFCNDYFWLLTGIVLALSKKKEFASDD